MGFAGTGTDVIGGHNIADHALTIESSFGDGLGTEMYIGNVTKFIRRRGDKNHYRQGLSQYGTWYDATLLNRRWTGSIELELNNGVPLALGLGYISATDDPTLSTLRGPGHPTPVKDFMPSFAFAVETTDGEVKGIKGATVTNLSVTVADNDKPTTVVLDYVAQAEDATNITGARVASPSVYGFHKTSLQYDDASPFAAAATTITNWTSYTLTVTPKLEIKPTINGTTIRQPYFKGFGKDGVKLSLDRYVCDDDFWSTTDFPTTITASFRLNQYIDASNYVYLDSQNVKLDDIEEGVDEEGLAMHRISLNARYASASIKDDQTYVAWD